MKLEEFTQRLIQEMNNLSGDRFRFHPGDSHHVSHIYLRDHGAGSCVFMPQTFHSYHGGNVPWMDHAIHVYVVRPSKSWESFRRAGSTTEVGYSMLRTLSSVYQEKFASLYPTERMHKDRALEEDFIKELAIYTLETVGVFSALNVLVDGFSHDG